MQWPKGLYLWYWAKSLGQFFRKMKDMEQYIGATYSNSFQPAVTTETLITLPDLEMLKLFLTQVPSIPRQTQIWSTSKRRIFTRPSVRNRGRKCQFPCYHNCETRIFFSHNTPKTIDSSPRRLSFDWRWNYLARVLVVYPSTDVETVDSNPSRLSLDRRNL